MALLPRPFRLDPRTLLVPTDPRNRPRHAERLGHTWEKATFTVPGDVSEERVQAAAPKYRNRLGEYLERQGWEVLALDGPHVGTDVVSVGITDPDRRRYIIWAKVRQRPTVVRVDVPDEDVGIYQNAGFRLV